MDVGQFNPMYSKQHTRGGGGLWYTHRSCYYATTVTATKTAGKKKETDLRVLAKDDELGGGVVKQGGVHVPH